MIDLHKNNLRAIKMISFLESIESFVNNFNEKAKVSLPLMDEIIVHPSLNNYLSDGSLFKNFWEALGRLLAELMLLSILVWLSGNLCFNSML